MDVWFPIHLAHGIKKTQSSRERHSGVLSEAAVNTSLRESRSIEGSVNDNQCTVSQFEFGCNTPTAYKS